MTKIKRHLGYAIRRMRKDRGLTQGQLAELAEVSGVTVAQIELGKANPTLSTLEAIAGVLETTLPSLLLSKPERSRRTDEHLKKLVGKNVRARRAAIGLTRNEVAERVGMKAQSLHTAENAISLPRLWNLIRIAEGLRIQPSWLLREDFNPRESTAPGTTYVTVMEAADRVRQERERRHLSVEDAVAILGWNDDHWYRVESPKKDISIVALMDICNGLRVELSMFTDNET